MFSPPDSSEGDFRGATSLDFRFLLLEAGLCGEEFTTPVGVDVGGKLGVTGDGMGCEFEEDDD